jgi:peptide/nickel transport system substrate-binding protein
VEPIRPAREVVLALPEAPDRLNPLYAGTWSSWALKSLFLPGLWHVDGRLMPHPDLALEVPSEDNGGVLDGGRTLVIHLRPDASWSDGQPVTAADVVFTHQMAIAPGNDLPTRFPYSLMEEVVATDDHTVEIRFQRPFAPWPSTLFPYVLPRHVLAPVFDADGTLDRAVWNRLPEVGGGPFIFAGEEGGTLLFKANPAYWRGRPEVDWVRVRFLPAPVERMAALSGGQADLAPFLWPESVGAVGAPAGVRLLEGPSGVVETLFFNLDPRRGHRALQQTTVRRAIALALNRELVCDLLAPGQAEPARSLWDGTLYEDPALDVFRSDGAAELLEAAGWRDVDHDGVRERDGVTFSLRYAVLSDAVDRTAVATAVVESLERVGIEITPVAWSEGNEWDLAQWAEPPAGYPDPDDPRWLCVEMGAEGLNRASVCDQALDELLYAQAETADLQQRADLFYQIEALNRERAWWVPLCRVSDLWGASDRIEGLQLWRGDPFWSAGGW